MMVEYSIGVDYCYKSLKGLRGNLEEIEGGGVRFRRRLGGLRGSFEGLRGLRGG